MYDIIDFNYTVPKEKERAMSLTISMDENLKREFMIICDELGLSASAAITVFAKAVVRNGGIPFEVTTLPQTGEYSYEMSPEHRAALHEELRLGLEQIERGGEITWEEMKKRVAEMHQGEAA